MCFLCIRLGFILRQVNKNPSQGHDRENWIGRYWLSSDQGRGFICKYAARPSLHAKPADAHSGPDNYLDRSKSLPAKNLISVNCPPCGGKDGGSDQKQPV